MKPIQFLDQNQVSASTAFTIQSYPVGRFRARRRVWVESRQGYGQRVVVQTEIPIHGGWYNPRVLTRFETAFLLYLDEDGKVRWVTLPRSASEMEIAEFEDRYNHHLTEFQKQQIQKQQK